MENDINANKKKVDFFSVLPNTFFTLNIEEKKWRVDERKIKRNRSVELMKYKKINCLKHTVSNQNNFKDFYRQ